jgi:DNA (cytosine-5)-methyltransferase 1
VGVDITPQPYYPLEFVQGDALTFPLDGFDAVHASVPCQAYSPLRHTHPDLRDEYPDLIGPMRERLRAAGVLYVLENVPQAPLESPIVLCGSMFRLRTFHGWLKRHRAFECNFPVHQPACDHPRGIPCLGVYGNGGHAGKARRGTVYEKRELMGIDWMTPEEINEAIPPAYTDYIGHWLMKHLLETESTWRGIKVTLDANPVTGRVTYS